MGLYTSGHGFKRAIQSHKQDYKNRPTLTLAIITCRVRIHVKQGIIERKGRLWNIRDRIEAHLGKLIKNEFQLID
jgi:hypothetical protein